MSGPFDLEHELLGSVRRMSALDSVRSRLALAIELGLLQPGEALPPVEQMAHAFDVSVVTVRRALASLSDEKVLVRVRGRGGGTYVAQAAPDTPVASIRNLRSRRERITTLIDQRLVMETGLAQLAVATVDAEGLAELDDLVHRMGLATEWAEFHVLDVAFHRRVAAMAGTDRALPAYIEVTDELYTYFLPYPMAYLRTSNDEHRELVNAMRAGDRTTVQDATVRHVAVLHDTMFVGLEK